MNVKKLLQWPARGGNTRTIKNDNFINPFREWLVGLTVATLLFIGGGIYFFLDYKISRVAMDTVPDVETTIIRYRQVDVAHFLTALEAREKSHQELRSKIVYRPIAPDVVDVNVATSSEDIVTTQQRASEE